MDPRASVIDGNLGVADLSYADLADVAAPADAIIRLEDQNRVPEMDQLLRGGETGEPGPDDNHVVAAGFVALSAAHRPGRFPCCCRCALGRRRYDDLSYRSGW
jgi:hypothetical protein